MSKASPLSVAQIARSRIRVAKMNGNNLYGHNYGAVFYFLSNLEIMDLSGNNFEEPCTSNLQYCPVSCCCTVQILAALFALLPIVPNKVLLFSFFIATEINSSLGSWQPLLWATALRSWPCPRARIVERLGKFED